MPPPGSADATPRPPGRIGVSPRQTPASSSENSTRQYRNDETLVFLCSVFTHMMPNEAANYIGEIARVLKPGGRCVVTYFLLNHENMTRMARGEAVFNFAHTL